MTLSDEQREQVKLQLEAHRHDRYEVDVELGEDAVLRGFVVYPKVLRPEVMTSLHLAKWLFSNADMYKDKAVLDMGCGSGIQGIVMGLYGAEHVIFSDLSTAATENTKENVRKFGIEDISAVYHGDLFEKISGKEDFIVFNHPFFSDMTLEGFLESSGMAERGKLIHRFLDESRGRLNSGGVVVMPYFHMAGHVNDPGIQAPKHGYSVRERLRENITSGLQRGLVSIYELRPQ